MPQLLHDEEREVFASVGFTKVRYRGLMKNTVRGFAAFALANLHLMRERLRPAGATCLL